MGSGFHGTGDDSPARWLKQVASVPVRPGSVQPVASGASLGSARARYKEYGDRPHLRWPIYPPPQVSDVGSAAPPLLQRHGPLPVSRQRSSTAQTKQSS